MNHLLGGERRRVLRDVNLSLTPGSCTVITGSRGSGKSSLLRCVYRMYRPDAGAIHLSLPGREVDFAVASERDVLRIRADHVGMVTQFLSVMPRLSALDLVATQSPSRETAAELPSSLTLQAELHELPPATFSGGERRLVNVAMALARRRHLLLLDEVTVSLDTARRRSVLAKLEQHKCAGTAILAIFHDLPDRPASSIVCSGSPTDRCRWTESTDANDVAGSADFPT